MSDKRLEKDVIWLGCEYIDCMYFLLELNLVIMIYIYMIGEESLFLPVQSLACIFGIMASYENRPVQTQVPQVLVESSETISEELDEKAGASDDAVQSDGQQPRDSNRAVDRKPFLKWNASWPTTFKSLATFYGMFVLGLNDAVYGVCILLASFTGAKISFRLILFLGRLSFLM